MESLATIESFVCSAEVGSFSAAARKLGVTPAAVSKNVAKLESGLGVRLFQRSTRALTLTEAGERFLRDASGGLATLRDAMDNVKLARGEPSGKLRVTMPVAFGRDYILPILPAFVERYPNVELDVNLDNRQVDLVREGFDAAVGGSLELGAGIVTRELSRSHMIAAASPAYLRKHGSPKTPEDLREHYGVYLRSKLTGRVRTWPFRNADGREVTLPLPQRAVFDDMEAVGVAAKHGLGIGLVSVPLTLKCIEKGELVRVLPKWHADAGSLSIYFASQKLLPAKTRAFVDFVVAYFKRERLAARFRAG